MWTFSPTATNSLEDRLPQLKCIPELSVKMTFLKENKSPRHRLEMTGGASRAIRTEAPHPSQVTVGAWPAVLRSGTGEAFGFYFRGAGTQEHTQRHTVVAVLREEC